MTNEEFIQSVALDGEEWRDVIGFEGLYKISSFGRIASMNKEVKHWRGSRILKPRILTPVVNKLGYYQTNLTKNNKRYYINIHRLVGEAFIPNPESKPVIDHIDRNKQNNHVSNLRWCSLEENMNNPNTIEHCKNIFANDSRIKHLSPIVALENNTVFKQYNSIKEAINDGFNGFCISKVCAGRIKSHKGLKWMYLSDYESLANKSKNKLPTQANYPQ